MSTPIDPYAVPDDLAERFVQVRHMVQSMAAPDPPEFFVVLMRYFLDAEPYMASGLTVSSTATPNIVQTQTGFTCDAFFRRDLLTEQTLNGKPEGEAMVRVRLEARLEDIIQIADMRAGG